MIRRFLNIIAVTAAVLAVSAPVRAETIAIVTAHISAGQCADHRC